MNLASFSDAWGSVCLCFVIDSTEHDANKIKEARAMLDTLATSQPGKPIVVAFSKCDIGGSPSTEMIEAFALEEIGEVRFFQVLEVSALTGLGNLMDALKAAAAEWH